MHRVSPAHIERKLNMLGFVDSSPGERTMQVMHGISASLRGLP